MSLGDFQKGELKMSELEKRVFEYLDDLRESGVVNMFGATPYIQKEFGVSKKEARELLLNWMKQF